ncbi:MAG TPA: sugar phosphate nucleotidyltransferase [Sphingobacteriaceae bacterium]
MNKNSKVESLKMLVLAGGFGSRLQSAVSDVPKPLAPVQGMPFLKFQLDNWVSQGVRSFVFLLHHRAEMIIDFLKSEMVGSLLNCEVKWIIEGKPMGTGGAIVQAINKLSITEGFLVTNADTWLSGGVVELAEMEGCGMAAIYVDNIERYGSVNLIDNRVVSFSEKGDKTGGGWINAGLCKLMPEVFLEATVPHDLPFSLEEVIFPQLALKSQFYAVPLSGTFIDIGIPEDYQRFCTWIVSKRKL